MPFTAEDIVNGLHVVGMRAQRPAYFSDDALTAAKKLGELSARLPGLQIRNGHVSTTIGPELAKNAQKIIEADITREYGTIEGRLEALFVHSKRYFNVYDPFDDTRIECVFGNRIGVKDLAGAIEKRVAVQGMIEYGYSGAISSVLADSFEVFPPDNLLPSADDVLGILVSRA